MSLYGLFKLSAAGVKLVCQLNNYYYDDGVFDVVGVIFEGKWNVKGIIFSNHISKGISKKTNYTFK